MQTSQLDVAPRCQEHWCRAERLYMLKCLFLEGGSHTAAELAARFDVTPNTIYADLQVLSTRLGVPLVRRYEVRWELMGRDLLRDSP